MNYIHCVQPIKTLCQVGMLLLLAHLNPLCAAWGPPVAYMQRIVQDGFPDECSRVEELRADADLTDKQVKDFCNLATAKYKKRLGKTYVLNLNDQQKITPRAIKYLTTCTAFSAISQIRICNTSMTAKEVMEVLKDITDSTIIGSVRDTIKISRPPHNCTCRAPLSCGHQADDAVYRSVSTPWFREVPYSHIWVILDNKKHEALQKIYRAPLKEMVHKDFAIRYTEGEVRHTTGIKWVEVAEDSYYYD